MDYPEYIEIDGKEYSINTDYRIAIECLSIVNDESINDFERAIAIAVMLFGENVPISDKTIELATKYLQCGETRQTQQSRKIDMDFEQDKAFIEASFMSDYQIDLSKTKMHWWKFCDLLSGLTEHCVLNRVREIRNYDLNDIKDHKTKQRIIEAQERFAIKIKLTQEEQEALDEFESLFL